jgi:hypothetical protein
VRYTIFGEVCTASKPGLGRQSHAVFD